MNMIVMDMLLCFTLMSFMASCVVKLLNPTRLSARYIADGSIKFSWGPPDTDYAIDSYQVYINVAGNSTGIYFSSLGSFRYYKIKPDTTYTIAVYTVISSDVKGGATTIITTPAAKYIPKGDKASLSLPVGTSARQSVLFNGLVLAGIKNGVIRRRPPKDITVKVTADAIELNIKKVAKSNAGYYFIGSFSRELTGEMLVVTDKPAQPRIVTSNPYPAIGTSVTLECSASSRSKPDNHGLVLSYIWKLNGSIVNNPRFSIKHSMLIINSVEFRDEYNMYKCIAREQGKEYIGKFSIASDTLKISPCYGPQYLTIEGAEGPVVIGDNYGPVICKTHCNPPCDLEWRRQGFLLTSSNSPSDQLVLVDRHFPRIREITYTCTTRQSSGCIPFSTREKNITVDIYFPAKITSVRYLGEVIEDKPDILKSSEGSSLRLSVEVESNPPSTVILLRDQEVVALGVLITDGNYAIEFDNIQCYHTGTYDVSATNYITSNRSNISPSLWRFSLQVSCFPRRLSPLNSTIEVLSEMYQIAVLNVTVIAYPRPTNTWSFGVTSLPLIKITDYKYIIRGVVSVIGPSDFQVYKLNVSNGVQEELTVTFQINQEGDTPTRPQMNWTTIALVVTIVILTLALVIAISVKIRKQNRHGQEYNPDTVARHDPQVRGNVHEGAESSLDQRQDHIYDTVIDKQMQKTNKPGELQSSATSRGIRVKANRGGDSVQSRTGSGYFEIGPSRGGAPDKIDNHSENFEMKKPKDRAPAQTDGGRPYLETIPPEGSASLQAGEYSGYLNMKRTEGAVTGDKTISADDKNDYIEVHSKRGKDHSYENTVSQTVDAATGPEHEVPDDVISVCSEEVK